jgi:pyruvate/2-oxoglutarate dehydrogenase complex dihydrolipoamide acyltransferase (E2) component
MKMEHALTAPFAGIVTELHAKPGQQVTEGTLLVRVEADSSPAEGPHQSTSLMGPNAGAQDSA